MVIRESSCLASIRYIPAKGELDLTFRSNETKHYVYEGVSREKARELFKSPSLGRAYHKLLRGQKAARTYEEVS